jgi:hypothetical protein
VKPYDVRTFVDNVQEDNPPPALAPNSRFASNKKGVTEIVPSSFKMPIRTLHQQAVHTTKYITQQVHGKHFESAAAYSLFIGHMQDLFMHMKSRPMFPLSVMY